MKTTSYKQWIERKAKQEKLWRGLNTFVSGLSEGTFASLNIFGFVIAQVFWVYLFKGFIDFFYKYLDFQSGFSLYVSNYEFNLIFWLGYLVWFVVMILTKYKIYLNIINGK